MDVLLGKKPRRVRRFFAMVVAVAGTGAALAGCGQDKEAAPPELSLPIDCKLGETCFVQNYVDIDPGPGVRDFACGSATYDGHKGVDIRVRSVAAADGVSVLAVADGKVLRGRDGMADKLLGDYASKAAWQSALKGKDCGNGLVIDHGGGWTTQYCHLKQGSLVVKPGQSVQRGQRLGKVGYSGRVEFAHVHITVRHNDKVVDPFTGQGQVNSCQGDAKLDAALWSPELRSKLAYATGTIIGAGFTGAPPVHSQLEHNHQVVPAVADSSALVFFARMMNLRKGDRVQVSVRGPEGFRVDNTTKPLARSKAVYSIFAGKKLRARRWPAGRYVARVAVLRKPGRGQVERAVDSRKVTLDLR